MSKIIAITTSKGGAGKTTLTAVLSTSFFNNLKIKTAVVDIDPQQSIFKKRSSELKEMKENPLHPASNEYKTISSNLKKMGTHFVSVYRLDLFQDIQSIMKDIDTLKEKYDVILLDFPGSLNLHVNTLNLLKILDYIFIPIFVDANTVDSSIVFYQELVKLKKVGKIKSEMYLFLNQYNDIKGKNGLAFKNLEELILSNNFPLLNAKVYDSVDVQRYSTILSLAPSMGAKNISNFTEEIANIIKK